MPVILFRLVARAVSLLVVLAVLVPAVVAARVWWTGRQDDRRASDVILVLGTAQYDGQPSEIFKARLEHAHELYADGVAPRVVTVGGSRPGDRFSEAAAARDFLVDTGVPAEAVVPVEEGEDTLHSVQAVAEVMDEHEWDSATVVTDPWHSLRTRTMLSDAGVHAVASPTPEGPTWAGEVVPRYVLRETAAYLVYQARELV